jgi:hypothetical protein
VLLPRAVLSALAHARGEHGLAVARVALKAAVPLIDEVRSWFYIDLVLDAVDADDRKLLEMEMDLTNYKFRSAYLRGELDGARTEGEARGKAAAVQVFLAARGIPVSEELRVRIAACVDVAVLDRWIARAATASTAEEVVSES